MTFPNNNFFGSIVPGQKLDKDMVFFDDFVGMTLINESAAAATGSISTWLKTSIDTDTDQADVAKIATDIGPGGWLQLKVNNNASDVENLQARGECFRILPGYDIYWGTRFFIDDISEAQVMIGLCATDTTLYAGTNDALSFRIDNDGNLDYDIEDDTNETTADTGIDLVDISASSSASLTGIVECAMWLKYPRGGTPRVKVYAQGGSGTTTSFESAWITTNIPDDFTDLTPSIEIGTGGTTVCSIFVDYFLGMERRSA